MAPTKAEGMVPIDPAALPGLDAKVQEYVESIVTLDVHSPAFATKAGDVRSMGDDDIRAAADTSNRLLASPVRAMQQGPLSEGGKVAATLLDLRRTIEDLDPKQATGVKKLLGMIPFGDKIVDYFRKYESAQSHLDAIIKALYDGQDELRQDNAALEQEKLHLWETMQRLEPVHLHRQAARRGARRADRRRSRPPTPSKAKALRDDVLFYVRQKHQDLLTQLAVSIQGYLAIDLVRKNNIELIKGVDRATTTTIAALRTAVIVAQALANQKLVLDQITALNTTTSKLIESTSELLATQSVDINKQAASATVGIESLQAAFANIYQSMDAIDTFKAAGARRDERRPSTALETEIDKSQAYLERVRASDVKESGARARRPRPRRPADAVTPLVSSSVRCRTVRLRQRPGAGSTRRCRSDRSRASAGPRSASVRWRSPVRHPSRSARCSRRRRSSVGYLVCAATGGEATPAAPRGRRGRGDAGVARRAGRADPRPGPRRGRRPASSASRAPSARRFPRLDQLGANSRAGARGRCARRRATCPKRSRPTCACHATSPTGGRSRAARRR